VSLAEVFFLVTAVIVPPSLGVVAALLRKPWWWAAVLGVVIAMVAAIAPQPEVGQSRVTSGDIPFLLGVAVFVTGLTWLSHHLTDRLWVKRRPEPRRATAS
jgi:type VI protein secretion system component VasK